MSDARPAAPTATRPPDTLVSRYTPDDLVLLDDDERHRFLDPFGETAEAALQGDDDAWRAIAAALAWELLYRKEPELWERFVAGERIHPDVLGRLPSASRAIEVAAGTGRLTFELAGRCDHVLAVEPVRAFRDRLSEKLGRRGITNVEVVRGFFDSIDAPDDSAELVVSCSAFTTDPAHGGDPALDEMTRVAAPAGMIALVWPPQDLDWLRSRGFTYESFDGDMAIEFASHEEAVELARIFFPDALDEIASRGSARVPYDAIGVNPPRDIAWKTVP